MKDIALVAGRAFCVAILMSCLHLNSWSVEGVMFMIALNAAFELEHWRTR